MDDIVSEIEEAFMTCGLTEEQEERILGIVKNGVYRSLNNFERGLELDQELRAIVNRLQSYS